MKIRVKSVRRKIKPEPVFNYVHARMRRLWQDGIRAFVIATTEELGKYRTSGIQASSKGDASPLVNTGMTISVLYPVASHREKGVRIGLGRLVRSRAQAYTQDAVSAFPYMASPKRGGREGRKDKRGKNRTRSRKKGESAGHSFQMDFGGPLDPHLSFSVDLDAIALQVPQIERHKHLEQSFLVGARAMRSYVQRNAKRYIKDEELIKYFRLGRIPNG